MTSSPPCTRRSRRAPLSKPTLRELENPDLYKKIIIEVPAYRDRSTGNIIFRGSRNEIRDKFICVVDSEGVPIIAPRRGAVRGLGGKILKALIAIFLERRVGIPMGVTNAATGLAREDARKAGALVRAFDKVEKENDLRGGAYEIVDAFGAGETKFVLDASHGSTDTKDTEEFLEEMGSLVGIDIDLG